MDFEIVGELKGIEPIAVGRGVRDRFRLNKLYGKGRLAEIARIRFGSTSGWYHS